MEAMEYVLNLLYFYAAAYSVYFLVLAFRNLNDGKFRIEKRYAAHEDKDNFAVIVYSHNNKQTLETLVNELKMQDYPVDAFRVFAILDNCIDGSEELFDQNSFVNVINIKDGGTVGKDHAVSALLERLTRDQTIDSYIFIDADRSIPADFLSTANAALSKNSAVSGETLMMTDNLGPLDQIKAAYQKYHMNFLRKARSLFGLAAQADSGVFIIKKDIVDKISTVDFKDINSELKYSLLLSKIGFPCTYNPNIKTFVDTANYEFKRPRLWARLSLFKNCFTKIFSKNFVFAEHTLSLLYPNIWLLAFIYIVLMRHSYNYYFIVDFKIVVFSALILTMGFGLSLINSKLTFKETMLLFLYPVYSLCHIIKNLPPMRFVKNKIQHREDLDTEKLAIDAVVMLGSKERSCRLEFISESGLAKVRFTYKDKKYATNKHIRMIDALDELKVKLQSYGLTLKICSSCANFSSSHDGSTNMLKGTCNTTKPTLIWNSCTKFEAGEISKKEVIYGV